MSNTIPDDVKQKIEAKYWLSTKHVPKERFQSAATFGYQLSREELEAKDKEIQRLHSIIFQAWEQSRINCEIENGAGDAGETFVAFKQFFKDNDL